MEEMFLSGVDPEDAELERARAEARSIVDTDTPNLGTISSSSFLSLF